MSTINRDLNSLNPSFKIKVEMLLKEAKDKGFDIMVFEWFRTLDRQKELYAQWRTKPWKIVTWTMQSKHLEWKAVDIVFKDSKWNPTWNWDYDSLIEIAKKYWIKNLKPAETAHFEDDWTLLSNIYNDMWEYETLFKKMYWDKWTIYSDLQWGIKKLLNEKWEVKDWNEFLYFLMIWLERIKKWN